MWAKGEGRERGCEGGTLAGYRYLRGEVGEGVGSREKVKKIEEGREKKHRNGWDAGMEGVERDEAREMTRDRDGRERRDGWEGVSERDERWVGGGE